MNYGVNGTFRDVCISGEFAEFVGIEGDKAVYELPEGTYETVPTSIEGSTPSETRVNVREYLEPSRPGKGHETADDDIGDLMSSDVGELGIRG